MTRPLSVKCLLSLAEEVAILAATEQEPGDAMVAELDALDNLSRTRLEWFIAGAAWQRDKSPVRHSAPMDPQPIVAEWQRRAARAEVRERRITEIAVVLLVAAVIAWALVIPVVITANMRADSDRILRDAR